MSSFQRLVQSSQLEWQPVASGVERRLFEDSDDYDRYVSSVLRLAPGAKLSPSADDSGGREVFVLEGSARLVAGTLTAGDASWEPAGAVGDLHSEAGCTLFVKSTPQVAAHRAAVHFEASRAPWLPGQGGLGVKPLHSFEGESTALVHWPAGERFVPHQHFGGEEILVLSGEFQDEHGRYPAGTWIRSPHLSTHHPFVEEETVIYVKTGHLPEPR